MEQKFHVKVSYNLAKLAQKLDGPTKVVDETRKALVQKHGKSEKGGQPTIQPNTPAMEAFSEEWAVLMTEEVEVDCEKVKLPDKIASTCDKCHHNMDKPYEIEGVVLLSLDKFIEVV